MGEANEVEALRKAAETGPARDQYNLGVVYLLGQGMATDVAAAGKWFRIAADKEYGLGLCCKGLCTAVQDAGVRSEEEAANWHRIRAEQGDASSQVAHGAFLVYGRGVSVDKQAAAEWFRKASEQGDADGQCAYGMMLFNGRGVPKDEAKAFLSIRKAAEQGVAHAQYGLGFLYANGRGVAEDYAQALKWYRLSVDQDCAWAYCNLGWMYQQGWGVEINKAEAANWYRKAAEKGRSVGQYNYGLICLNGAGVETDPAEAKKWLQLAATQGESQAIKLLKDQEAIEERDRQCQPIEAAARAGDVAAQFQMGEIARQGPWSEDQFDKACAWYRQAANQGHVESKLILAETFRKQVLSLPYEGEITAWIENLAEQGNARAQYNWAYLCEERLFSATYSPPFLHWLFKAADQDYPPALHDLGKGYESGDGVEQDEARAFGLYRKAAEMGYTPAQHMLGVMYLEGRGTPADGQEAFKWLRKALDGGENAAGVDLGRAHEKQNTAHDDLEAVKYFRDSMDFVSDSSHHLGRMYDRGRGVPQDNQEAARLYLQRLKLSMAHTPHRFYTWSVMCDIAGRRNLKDLAVCRQAAEGGDLLAQVECGLRTFDLFSSDPGENGPAKKWIQTAALGGNALGQFSWACSLVYDSNKPYDEASMQWFTKAAEQGLAEAQYVMAEYCLDHAEPEAALQWLKQAADQGYGPAQYQLGSFYAEGKIVPQDFTEAVKWCRMALEWNFKKQAVRIRVLLKIQVGPCR